MTKQSDQSTSQSSTAGSGYLTSTDLGEEAKARENYEKLLASLRSPESTTDLSPDIPTQEPMTRALPWGDRPRRIVRPEIPREWSRVSRDIRDAMRDCGCGTKPWPLYVWGEPGTGKTCAALCLSDMLKRGSTVDYWDASDLCDAMNQMRNGEYWQEQGAGTVRIWSGMFWRSWRAVTLAVVDELGTRETASDWQAAVITEAISKRYPGKPLVLLSNASPAELAKLYGDRIASRACCGTVVNATGEDRRLT
jgi:hypothetical protein